MRELASFLVSLFLHKQATTSEGRLLLNPVPRLGDFKFLQCQILPAPSFQPELRLMTLPCYLGVHASRPI